MRHCGVAARSRASPTCRLRALRQAAARPHSMMPQSVPSFVKLNSKFGKKEELPKLLQEEGFSLWNSFLDAKEHDKFVNGLLRSDLRAERVDESIGTFKRYRQPFEELLEVMEKIEDSGLLKGVQRSDNNMGVFWVDDIEPRQRVEPAFELPGTGDRTFLINFFSPVVYQLHKDETTDMAPRICMQPGSLLALTGSAKVRWIRIVDPSNTWEGKSFPPRRRFEFKLVPTFDQQFMQHLVDSAEGTITGLNAASNASGSSSSSQ